MTPWTAVCQASLSFTFSLSLLKFMSTESVMPFNHLILCHPLLFPPSIFSSIRVFSNESVLSMNIQDWFPLGWTGWISLLSKGLSRVYFNSCLLSWWCHPTISSSVVPFSSCLQSCSAAAAAKSCQSCLTLCSPPGFPVPGILQARTLEWVAISFFSACTHAKSLQSCLILCCPMDRWK